jgi:hypothetical protein
MIDEEEHQNNLYKIANKYFLFYLFTEFKIYLRIKFFQGKRTDNH